jgi:hypothetical protein
MAAVHYRHPAVGSAPVDVRSPPLGSSISALIIFSPRWNTSFVVLPSQFPPLRWPRSAALPVSSERHTSSAPPHDAVSQHFPNKEPHDALFQRSCDSIFSALFPNARISNPPHVRTPILTSLVPTLSIALVCFSGLSIIAVNFVEGIVSQTREARQRARLLDGEA